MGVGLPGPRSRLDMSKREEYAPSISENTALDYTKMKVREKEKKAQGAGNGENLGTRYIAEPGS